MKIDEDVISLYSINSQLQTYLNDAPITFPTTISPTFAVTTLGPNQFQFQVGTNFSLKVGFYGPRFDLYLYLQTDLMTPALAIEGGLCGGDKEMIGSDGSVVPTPASQSNIFTYGQSCTWWWEGEEGEEGGEEQRRGMRRRR